MDQADDHDWTRRAVIAGGAALFAKPSAGQGATPTALVAGTYAQEGGAGLYPLTASGPDWAIGAALPTFRNASFAVRSPRSGQRYLLDESSLGQVAVCDRDFKALSTHPSLGAGPCHVALSPDERALAIANYNDGIVALLPLDATTGLPIGEGQAIQHRGRGPNGKRQQGPHAHWVGFTADSRWLHSVDLGADAIFAHRVLRDAGQIGETRIAYRAPPGSGPRHLTRHPHLPVAYLVSELANTVTVLATGPDGTFSAKASLSTLPDGFHGESAAAHIALNAAATRLYISNRGHNSIAVFGIAADGGARLLQHIDSGGNWPRCFLLVEERHELLVANERSGSVTRLPVLPDGRLDRATEHYAIPGVAFLGR